MGHPTTPDTLGYAWQLDAACTVSPMPDTWWFITLTSIAILLLANFTDFGDHRGFGP